MNDAAASSDKKLDVLYQHFQDTCGTLHAFRSQRDRFFYLIIATLSFTLYDVYAPVDFSRIVAEGIRTRAGLETTPDLAYLATLLSFLLLGFFLRYCQIVVSIDRQYTYLHALEDQLSLNYATPAFTREGRSYLTDYPLLSTWSHYAYTIGFPVLLALAVAARAWTRLRGAPAWTLLSLVDLAAQLATLLTLLLYLITLYRLQRGNKAPAAPAAAGAT